LQNPEDEFDVDDSQMDVDDDSELFAEESSDGEPLATRGKGKAKGKKPAKKVMTVGDLVKARSEERAAKRLAAKQRKADQRKLAAELGRPLTQVRTMAFLCYARLCSV
jgi:hypothetical protein